jgi:hypothetical protein
MTDSVTHTVTTSETTAESSAAATTGALLIRFSDQVGGLIRDEIALAKLEIAEKGKRLGIGGGLLGAAAFLALYGLGALLVTAGLALALVLDGWLAALVVAGAIFLLVAILAVAGVQSLKRGGPPIPTEAIDGAKRDLATVTKRGA